MKHALTPKLHTDIHRRIGSFFRYVGEIVEEDAAVTSIEYALIASLIAIVIVAAVGIVGTNLDAVFSTVAADF